MTYTINNNGLIRKFSDKRTTTGDLILVQRGSQSFKCDVSDLDNIEPNDLILANLGGQSYQLKWSDVPTANGNALVLVNRLVDDPSNPGQQIWKSFRASLAELRGSASVDVTFDVVLQTPQISQQIQQVSNTTCNGNNYTNTSPGGRLTATVTAKSTSGFTVNGNQLTIDGEWIMVCGSSGDFGSSNTYSWFGSPPTQVCFNGYKGSQQIPTYGSVGSGASPSGGVASTTWGDPALPETSGQYGQTGAGGYGCPGGNRGSSQYNSASAGYGGVSNTRPRADNTGDTFGEITVVNPVFTTHTSTSTIGTISANGITLTGSGIIGELIPLS